MLAPTRDVTLRGRLRAFGIWQLPTSLLAAAVWAALTFAPAASDDSRAPTVGLVVVLLAGLALLAVDWARIGFAWRILVPTLDLAGAVVINEHAQPTIPAAMLLATIPVVWLGFEFGRRGVAVATLGVLGFALAPAMSDVDVLRQALPMVNVVLVTAIGVGVAAVASVVGQVLTETQLRLVSDAHRLSKELDTLNAMMSAVDAAIVVMIDGEAPRLNAEASRIAAHGEVQVSDLTRGHRIYERDGVTLMPAHRQPLARAAAGETFRDLMHYVGRPGEQVALVSSCHRITAADGTHIGSVIVGFDATALVDAVRVREEFLTTVSHELRTPLTSIIAPLEMLHGEIDDVRRGASTPDVAERLLSIARRNAGTLLSRINLLLSAAPGAVEEMNPRPTDLARLTREAVVKHREHSADRGIVLEVEARDELVVDVDPVAYERVVDNLVSNAIKYTLAGGRVTVSLARLEDGIHLGVSDTGIGMSRDEQRQVFDRFYRSNAVVDAAMPGIGIGLTVTKRLVHLLGGTITVESERGRGTTMRVALPSGPAHGPGALVAGTGMPAHGQQVVPDDHPDEQRPRRT